jgi:hypothetical protein
MKIFRVTLSPIIALLGMYKTRLVKKFKNLFNQKSFFAPKSSRRRNNFDKNQLNIAKNSLFESPQEIF